MATQPLIVYNWGTSSPSSHNPTCCLQLESLLCISVASERSSKSYPGKVSQACPGTPRRWGGFTDGIVWQDVLTHLFTHQEVERQHHPQEEICTYMKHLLSSKTLAFSQEWSYKLAASTRSDVWSVDVFFWGQSRSIVPRKILRDAKDDVNGLMSQRRKHQDFMVLNSLRFAT